MLIGKGFNKKCEQILKRAAEITDYQPGHNISVEELNEDLGFGRREIKYYFEYMNDQKLIELTTIGGPFLYGHISITLKGIAKIKALQKKENNS
ncbi:hypothetical protein [Rhodohalobacter sp. 614A]|uniref:hypothetical protein n=1 Tax=Rhodohalobacter sp. 614A TaxID=2908649 RepID=UPI001F40AD2C|nr:hypothetical protein [Rhodohalobacter sp. 614A]